VSFVEITGKDHDRKVHLKVTNHSDKPIRRVDVELSYLDAQGRPPLLAPDFPAAPSPSSILSRGRPLIVEAGATVETNVPAFHMPQETARVAVTLRRVEFADATSWRPDRENP
jgi:hypothetical protein